MSKEKIKRPYCRIDGKAYQLQRDYNNVLRFPNNDHGKPVDLNIWFLDYFNGKCELNTILEYYVNSGSSYELVYNTFSKRGMNNHMVTQGKELPKSFRLYVKYHE